MSFLIECVLDNAVIVIIAYRMLIGLTCSHLVCLPYQGVQNEELGHGSCGAQYRHHRKYTG